MNMSVRFPVEIGDGHIPLNAFSRARHTPAQTRGRYIGGVIVILGHMALIAAIIWGGSQVYRAMAPQPISVAIISEAPPKTELPPPPPPPKLEVPEVAVTVAPEITITTPPSNAITVQQVKNPAPVAPPSPVNGTGKDAYLGQIIAHLDAAKHYPPQARKLHIEGVVQLHFVMDRSGHVLSFDIAKSSGRPILDEETRALIARAQPLPPIPADWPQQTLNLVVPVEFELR
ncbi:MAG TPA: energy transducer TonB [Rhizomicrobium sp.]|nr:energy transducer TonB [Rhizomicrobium sp.]